MTRLLVHLIRAYQYLVSPFLGNNCRYHPTCSDYACQAVRAHGPLQGLWLALRRIGRCHPWSAGGHDPVPDRPVAKNN
jgi:putative membrane protein insertion efficiency factor